MGGGGLYGLLPERQSILAGTPGKSLDGCYHSGNVLRGIEQARVDGCDVGICATCDGWKDGDDSEGQCFEKGDGKPLVVADEKNEVQAGEHLPVGIAFQTAVEGRSGELFELVFEPRQIGAFADDFQGEKGSRAGEAFEQGRKAIDPFLFLLDSAAESDAERGSGGG